MTSCQTDWRIKSLIERAMTRLRRNKEVHSASVYYLNRVNPKKVRRLIHERDGREKGGAQERGSERFEG